MSSVDDTSLPLGTFVTNSAEQTFELGSHLGQRLKAAAVLLLSGELGAGKTVFAKGVADGLGIDSDDVTSPSFTLVNKHHGRLNLYHIDLYRLDTHPDTVYAVGLDEILAEPDTVVLIEWPERLGADNFPEGAIRVEIAGDGDDPRQITIALDC